MSSLKKKIKTTATDYMDSIRHICAKRAEIRKYEDARRKAIYESITLTVEQKHEIDDLYVKNYGSKIPYTWHQHFTAFTRNFDPAYIPETLYIPEFEHYMNLDKSYVHVFEDKNVLSRIAGWGGGKNTRDYSYLHMRYISGY